MGLLEDAIREHLELKRLRGADPAEVAREQHEALEPPVGEERSEWAEGTAPAGAGEDHHVAGEPTGEPPAEVAPGGGEHAPQAPQATAEDFPHVGEETAELDMRAVMAEEQSPQIEEDSLEWEMPSRDDGTAAASPGPAQEAWDGEKPAAAEEDHTPGPEQGRLSL